MSTSGSLMPRSDSLSRTRGSSHIVSAMFATILLCLRLRWVISLYQDFKTATTGVAAKAMKNELSRLVDTVNDPSAKKVCPFLLLRLLVLTIECPLAGVQQRDAVVLLPLYALSRRPREGPGNVCDVTKPFFLFMYRVGV